MNNNDTYINFIRNKQVQREDKDNIFCTGISDAEFVKFAIKYLLGDGWYVVDPLGHSQVTQLALEDILFKYSKQFKKEYKQFKKEYKHLKKEYKHLKKERRKAMRKQKEGFTIKVEGPEFKGLVEMLKERGINLHIEDVNVEEDIFTLRAFASDDVYVLKSSDMKCEEPSDMKCEEPKPLTLREEITKIVTTDTEPFNLICAIQHRIDGVNALIAKGYDVEEIYDEVLAMIKEEL